MREWKMRGFIGAVCLMAWMGISPLAAMQESIQRSFAVSSGGRLIVEAERGSIEVASEEGSEVRIEIIPGSGDAADFEKEYELSFDQSGRDVSIRIENRAGRKGWFNWGSRRGFRLKAKVPYRFDVDLKTSGGSISVADLAGEVRSKTSGGSLTFGNIEGPVWGRTSGGSIRLDGGIGDADIQTSGGSIDIGEIEGRVQARTSGGSIEISSARGSVDAKTSGGSITVEEVIGSIRATTSGGSVNARFSSQPREDCELSTSGGNVTIELARGLRFDLDAKASGGVSSDVSMARGITVGKREVRGPINGGGPRLLLRTSGKIRIKGLN